MQGLSNPEAHKGNRKRRAADDDYFGNDFDDSDDLFALPDYSWDKKFRHLKPSKFLQSFFPTVSLLSRS